MSAHGPAGVDVRLLVGDMEFAPHVRAMVQLDSIEAHVDFAPEPMRGADRKELAEKLHRAVKSRFRPVP